MDKINDGGPAFPRAAGHSGTPGFVTQGQPGMSMRDWFAGMALQAVLHDYCDSNSKYAELATKECYLFADAMLKAREADNG